MCARPLIASLILVLAGCSDPHQGGGGGADTEASITDVAPVEDATVPSETEDSAQADAAPPSADTSVTSDAVTADATAAWDAEVSVQGDVLPPPSDASAPDVAPEDVAVEPSCEALQATANEALAAAGAGCGAADSCLWFEFPICGSFGCFQGAIREDAATDELTALQDAAMAGMNAGCEPFHCGCGWPEGAPVCLQGECRMCPGDCGDSCEDVEGAIGIFAAALASGCTTDDECQVLQVAPCSLGDAITCHGLPYRQGTDPSAVEKLITGAEQVGCEYFECDCQLTESTCEAGVCVPAMQ